jgi:hypothetical protein
MSCEFGGLRFESIGRHPVELALLPDQGANVPLRGNAVPEIPKSGDQRAEERNLRAEDVFGQRL